MSTFVPIPDYPAYEISDEGVVRSLRFDPPKIIGQRLSAQGYLRVALYRGKGPEDWHVHVLVARAFLPDPEPGQEVRHTNSDPLDNRASNLAWGTRKENVDDMMAMGNHYLQKPLKKYRCGGCSMTSTAPGIARHQKTWKHTGRIEA